MWREYSDYSLIWSRRIMKVFSRKIPMKWILSCSGSLRRKIFYGAIKMNLFIRVNILMCSANRPMKRIFTSRASATAEKMLLLMPSIIIYAISWRQKLTVKAVTVKTTLKHYCRILFYIILFGWFKFRSQENHPIKCAFRFPQNFVLFFLPRLNHSWRTRSSCLLVLSASENSERSPPMDGFVRRRIFIFYSY